MWKERISQLACKFGWHVWGKSKFYQRTDSYARETDKIPSGSRNVYIKGCQVCGVIRHYKEKL